MRRHLRKGRGIKGRGGGGCRRMKLWHNLSICPKKETTIFGRYICSATFFYRSKISSKRKQKELLLLKIARLVNKQNKCDKIITKIVQIWGFLWRSHKQSHKHTNSHIFLVKIKTLYYTSCFVFSLYIMEYYFTEFIYWKKNKDANQILLL